MHQKYLAMMEKECGYGLGKVPQLEDVSNFLKSEAKFVCLTSNTISQEILDSRYARQPDSSLLETFLHLLHSEFSRFFSALKSFSVSSPL